MSEIASLNEITVHFEAPNEGGESSGRALKQPLQNDNDSSSDQGAAPVAGDSKSSSINLKSSFINSESSSIKNAAATSLNQKSEQPAAMKGKQSDETIESLAALLRDLLEVASNPATSNFTHNTQRNTAERKRFFGLTKGSQPETASNNRYDYEQKYPRDRPGEEVADDARVWLTYLDEAEVFDRERVDGWKETADVLLVFAGLFSGVITTFVSQASQSLQQDNTQVSASLLYEITQLLRAQSSGTPLNNIPSSPLTPTSPFTPSTNAFLVNGLWLTSLAITLSTALFAVLTKQWLYYYLTSITGTAHEKVRARQLRFNGFELWKVGAIVDLLPILLHLAVGIFLTGIIILLFPLDIRVAWTIVIITGITYLLYFISVILPVRYPECPYTTSLTIYVGVLVFFLQTIVSWISRISAKKFQAVWRRINSQVCRTIWRLLQHTYSIFQHAFSPIFKLVAVMRRVGTLRVTLFTEEFPKFTKWREENIKKAVKNAAFLDFEALDWLYVTSPNRSFHRIIARCVAVHPSIGQQFGPVICHSLLQTLEVNETNLVDLRYGLCLDLLTDYHIYPHWNLLRSIPDVEESQLEEAEYRSYSHIAEDLLYVAEDVGYIAEDVGYVAGDVLYYNPDKVMEYAINNDLKLPLAMWSYFFAKMSVDATFAAHILTCNLNGLFNWKIDLTAHESIRNAGVVSFNSEELGWWIFKYLHRYFRHGSPDYSLDMTFETRYLLLINIYRNLTSANQPSLIADKEQRQESLLNLFGSFNDWLGSKPHVSSDQYFAFFFNIFCVDAFWSDDMKGSGIIGQAVSCLDEIWELVDTDVVNRFPFTECDDLSSIYQWCSRDLDSDLSSNTAPIFAMSFMLLFMPWNRDSLRTLLSRDPEAVSHLSKIFQNMGNCYSFISKIDDIFPNLMDLLKSVDPKVPLFTVLYNSTVLVQLWRVLVYQESDVKKFFLDVESKLDREKVNDLYAAINEQVARGRPTPQAYSRYEFEQMIGVSYMQLESTTQQSALEHAADKDHDTEERAHVPQADANERKGPHSIANWTKKAFGSVWPKTSD